MAACNSKALKRESVSHALYCKEPRGEGGDQYEARLINLVRKIRSDGGRLAVYLIAERLAVQTIETQFGPN